MLCPLQGKKLSRLTFLFLRDAQRLGPREVKATEGQSTSLALHCPSTPAASLLELLSAKDQASPIVRILRPAATATPPPPTCQEGAPFWQLVSSELPGAKFQLESTAALWWQQGESNSRHPRPLRCGRVPPNSGLSFRPEPSGPGRQGTLSSATEQGAGVN